MTRFIIKGSREVVVDGATITEPQHFGPFDTAHEAIEFGKDKWTRQADWEVLPLFAPEA